MVATEGQSLAPRFRGPPTDLPSLNQSEISECGPGLFAPGQWPFSQPEWERFVRLVALEMERKDLLRTRLQSVKPTSATRCVERASLGVRSSLLRAALVVVVWFAVGFLIGLLA